MKKYYVFSEMFGNYSYTIVILEANSIEQAVKKSNELKKCKIKGYNYDPQKDIDKFHFLNDHGNKKKFPEGQPERWRTRTEANKIFGKLFKNPYKELLSLCKDSRRGISGELFLNTNTIGWFDWIVLYGDLPENYNFIDGHDG